MITINNTMFFDSDDEFYEFAVIPYARVKTVYNNGERESYIDFDMSSMYNKALADNYNFIIRDEDSKIYKHGCVNVGVLSKPVEHLEPYFRKFTEKLYDKDRKFFTY